MGYVFKLWARGMAFFGGLAAVITFWNYVILPLFYNYAAFRLFAAFVIVSIVAIIFGGVMTHTGAPYHDDDDTSLNNL